MGEVIRKAAAVADILADVRSTRAAAELRGGTFAITCRTVLGPAGDAADAADAAWQVATAAQASARLARDQALRDAALAVGRVSDDLRDALGRPASDPDLELAFPGGWSQVFRMVEGTVRRIEIAADLVARIDRLEPALAATLAGALRTAAEALGPVVRTSRVAEQEALDAAELRTRRVRAAQVHLSRLKKAYRAQGYGEADIHRVIPDRPSRGAAPTAVAAVAPVPVVPPLALVTDAPADAAADTAEADAPAEDDTAAA